jgi:hypothetical protein
VTGRVQVIDPTALEVRAWSSSDHLFGRRTLQQANPSEAAGVVRKASVGQRLGPRPETHFGGGPVHHVLELMLLIVEQPGAALAAGAQVAPAARSEPGDEIGGPVSLLVGEHRTTQQRQSVIADRARIDEHVGVLVEVGGRCVTGSKVALAHDRHQRVGVGAHTADASRAQGSRDLESGHPAVGVVGDHLGEQRVVVG